MQATETPSTSATAHPPEPPPPAAANGTAPQKRGRRTWLIAGAAVLAVAAIVAAALLFLGGDDELTPGEPKVVSTSELSDYAQDTNTPVFWAGAPANGFKLELTEVKGGRVYVRYITSSAKAGDPRPAYTTVATYPMKNAAAQLEQFAKSRPGAIDGKGPNGAITLYYRKAPSSVYVAHPGSDHVIEVYAPQPTAALQIAESDTLVEAK